ncbi:hypothetical protein B484DRAFT_403442 [Ochromonadaceae sp. CCMP2298]|nr:hypothetical protein B484DRAFT_403442 [Ochromonadaceae sp. CCMP2298]
MIHEDGNLSPPLKSSPPSPSPVMSQSQISETSEFDLPSSPDVGRPVSVTGAAPPVVARYPFGTGTQGSEHGGSDSGIDSADGTGVQSTPAAPQRPARKSKAKFRVTALGGIVEESGAEESEPYYDTAVKAKGPAFIRDRSLDAVSDPSAKGGARKGVQIPRAPKAKADWEDERKIARACGQFHPLPLILGESDAAARDAAFALASAADDGQDGKYELYCHVTALLGAQTPIPMKTTVKQLGDMLQDTLALIEECRASPLNPPQGRRYPLPPPGTGGHPTIDEMPLSSITFATLASTDPRMLAYDDLSWFHTVERAHRFLSKLFKVGGPMGVLQPAALRVILTAYTPLLCGVLGIHPVDAVLVLQGLCPGRAFFSPDSAEKFLRGMVHYAHMFNYVCEDFLHRYFPRLLLGIFEFWMEETFAREVQVVIARARVLGKGFMSLSRQLFCPVNEFNLLHLGGHYPRLREMFPRYYEQTRGVKVQMFLTFWHYTHMDYSIEFYIHMTVFGGIAGGASPLPPRILYTNQTPLTSDVAILAEWMEVVAREPLSDNDRIEHYAGFEQRDFVVLPADGELDYDMHGTPLHTEAAEPTVSAHPFTHPIFRAIIAVKKWRRAPLVKACLESPPTSMTANFQDALSLNQVVHRSDPPPTEARPYADAAAHFDAEVLHQLQTSANTHFDCAWPLSGATPATSRFRSTGPSHRSGDRFSAPGWEHLPHDCDEDHSYSDRSGSGSDPEQGITAPYPYDDKADRGVPYDIDRRPSASSSTYAATWDEGLTHANGAAHPLILNELYAHNAAVAARDHALLEAGINPYDDGSAHSALWHRRVHRHRQCT